MAGDLLGTLEILIPDEVCNSEAFDDIYAINFYRSDGLEVKWTYFEICEIRGEEYPTARFFVTAIEDTISVCLGQCN